DHETLTGVELAIRFLVHYIGDIHQSLHAQSYELSWNNIKLVYFNKKITSTPPGTPRSPARFLNSSQAEQKGQLSIYTSRLKP
ncbi:hypothetical protein EV426DRAFT_541170, partial [Tirmania nivea]